LSDEETFASRWARRKRAVAEEAASETAAPASEPGIEEPEERALERLGLPDPDTLAAGDDFAAFMQKGVPAALRRRALRRLWTSNPVLANLDGLNDYDDDYAAAALSPDVVATAYKVGRGFVKSVVEAEDYAVAEAAGDGSGEEGRHAEAPVPEEETPEAEGSRGVLSHPLAVRGDTQDSDEFSREIEIPLPPRRMRFRTDT